MASQSNTSVSQFLSVLIPTFVMFVVFTLAFISLRKKQARVYEPRTTVKTVPDELVPDVAPRGAFSWVSHILLKPEPFIIQQTGVDGYFFIRYLFEFGAVALLGCFILWPILFPINATNSNHQQGLDAISYSNVNNKWRFLAHVFLSWIFFGCVIFLIYRELHYYTTFRHVVQTTPLYDSLLSSRVMLLTEIPSDLYAESRLRELFPSARHVWYGRDYKELQDDVKERTKLANKYEGTLNGVVTKSLKKHAKLVKKGKPVPEQTDDFEQFIKKRPTHKLKFLIGKKVDTLEYGVEHLEELNTKISKQQVEYKSNKQEPAVFIEFPTQLELQKAYQAIEFNKTDLKGVRKFTGITPDDVIWENLSLTKTKRRIKKIIANTILTLMVIFWAIPVAVVGAISNINNLTNKVKFLRFIDNMPEKIMGIITGLLPVVALAVLMLLVPPFIKKMGKISGIMTVQDVEGYCQSWFYAFQVVNSFIVITVTSAAASSVTTIINDPLMALRLLAQKIPPASNFYITYLCLQGLVISSGLLLQLVGLILAQFLGKILDKTPRAQWKRWNTLGSPGWSTVYPAYQFLTVIVLCYSIIAPLVLGFAFVTFILIYLAFNYNLIYVLKPNSSDARGRNYPRALFQTFVGLYLAEVCLTAMFVFGKNWVCVALEGFFIFVTAVAHIYLKWKFLPLFDIVPISALRYAAGDSAARYPVDQGTKEVKIEGANYWEGGAELKDEGEKISDSEGTTLFAGGPIAKHNAVDSLSVGGATGTSVGEAGTPFGENDEFPRDDVEKHVGVAGTAAATGTKPITWLKRFFNPRMETYDLLRAIMPTVLFNYIEYNDEFLQNAYDDPSVTDKEPTIWVAKDKLGIAEHEQAKAQDHNISVVTDNAEFNEKNKVTYTGPPPAYEEALKL